jgi:DNA-binding NtrC family response regulator
MEADSILRDVLVSLFRSEGIEVVLCSSLMDIWGAVDASPSDVAIVDVDCGSQRVSKEAQQRAVRALGEVVPVIVFAEEPSPAEAECSH